MKRLFPALLLAGLALFLSAGPAAAHDVLIGSDPADGSSVAVGPAQAVLRFNLPVQAGFNSVVVIGPDGSAWQAGEPQAKDGVVTVALRPLGPAGRYEIRYRVVSSDGHPVSGTVGFTLTTPGPGTPSTASVQPYTAPAAAAGESGSGDAPVWPWIAGALVLVAAGVGVALRLGR